MWHDGNNDVIAEINFHLIENLDRKILHVLFINRPADPWKRTCSLFK